MLRFPTCNLLVTACLLATAAATAAEENREREVDTEFLLGFTAGGDVAEATTRLR